MADREKVIKGLETCIKHIDREDCPTDCPYHEICRKYEGRVVFQPVLRDALALLKEQEALIRFLEHQREKGHWIFGETNGHGWMKCSQCCVSQDGQTSCYLFCPCCGADMTEGR